MFILGALSSVSQLHYWEIRGQYNAQTSVECNIQHRVVGLRLVAHPEELAETRIVWLAGLPLCIFKIFCKPEADYFKHSIERLIGSADGNEGVGCIEIGPVLEIGGGLEQLGGERESDAGEIRDADEPNCTKRVISMFSDEESSIFIR